jgi:hypothetical protein
MAYIKRIKLPNVTESYDIYDPSAVHSVNNKTGTAITLSAADIGLGNVDNVKQYSSSNPPPYPVKSVNSKTGAVTLTATDVGARPSTWTPSKSDVGLGNVDNVKQYSASNPPPYPVTSVNGKTGAVTIEAGGSSIPVQANTPTGQKVGDLWFKVV